ncbi:hypothetical protein A0H81_03550 [Grifola frondosa]|uniref:Rdx family-domain-containing protein n=1 Tax=Grifola frondosa TaxID=5627 RepID=A0A1C7MIL5_GRIFR|nr:hypothetical protein A0H81_03550 [Grifola frondosa]
MADPGSCVDCLPDSQTESYEPQVPAKPHDPLDPSTFIPPSPLPTPSITIEFCDRCRWLHRATWVSTELLLTFPTPALKAISILPLNSEETNRRRLPRVENTQAAHTRPDSTWQISGALGQMKPYIYFKYCLPLVSSAFAVRGPFLVKTRRAMDRVNPVATSRTSTAAVTPGSELTSGSNITDG